MAQGVLPLSDIPTLLLLMPNTDPQSKLLWATLGPASTLPQGMAAWEVNGGEFVLILRSAETRVSGSGKAQSEM